jgi:hypothetical protein
VRRVVLVLLAVVLLVPAVASARTYFTCPDGRIVEEPCCPDQAKEHAARPPGPSSVEPSPCCRMVVQPLRTDAPRLRPVPVALDHVLVAPLATVVVARTVVPVRTTATSTPLRSACLFVRHCSLLL